jgi:uncharacterized protein YaaQ
MKEVAQASAQIDELEDKIYPDGDNSEVAQELRKKEYRLRKLREAREILKEGESQEGKPNRS